MQFSLHIVPEMNHWGNHKDREKNNWDIEKRKKTQWGEKEEMMN